MSAVPDGALRVQNALNIREWAGRRKQKPVRRLYLSSKHIRYLFGIWVGWRVVMNAPPEEKTASSERWGWAAVLSRPFSLPIGWTGLQVGNFGEIARTTYYDVTSRRCRVIRIMAIVGIILLGATSTAAQQTYPNITGETNPSLPT